ncbi:MAG TPA: FKBP-type peptidyl-prolyl cis-trans isomerase [Candidatus Methylacidiphilales bacterium]|jgi:peptidylprolyl isomerase|nr:FKBP-type peptidyl-prolyl cis-trans isomerase [Candidatus Methylacidiphilales bacterium]
MKLPSTFRYRRLIFAGMLFAALSFSATSPVFFTSIQAQTNAPASTAPSAETDKETGKPIVATPSGLKYVDIVVGAGPAVKSGDHVTVKYVGKLIDGTKFDASADHGGTFDYVQGVTALIAGWTEGTSTMKVGGKRKLIIPPQLGYGMQGAGDAIPPNATLIFEIEVVSSTPAPK